MMSRTSTQTAGTRPPMGTMGRWVLLHTCRHGVCHWQSRNDDRDDSLCHCHTNAVPRMHMPVVRLNLGRDRGQDQHLAQRNLNHSAWQQQTCAFHALSVCTNFGVLTPEITQALFLERLWLKSHCTVCTVLLFRPGHGSPMGTGDGDDPRSPANRGWGRGWTPDPRPFGPGWGWGWTPRSPAT
jgi:hypothetical protein